MNRIAVLTACHNRKTKTLSCLDALYNCALPENTDFDVYLVDDGSADGTADAVRRAFPQVRILQGTGSLFWAGAMRFAWKEALNQNYDGYLLLNDDTNLFPSALMELLSVHHHSLKKYNKGGIYVGATNDPDNHGFTYGGKKIVNRFTGRSMDVIPQKEMIQSCDFANGNILLVSSNVIETNGILSGKFTHLLADYDYTFAASKKKYPVLECDNYCGSCVIDHGKNWISAEYPLSDRLHFLFDPKHLAYNEYLYFVWRYFPLYWPFSLLKLWAKTLFPSIWDKFKR